ncbi:MAG: ABC transporter C-terminal domain-containing protein [Bacteroidota bacterium]
MAKAIQRLEEQKKILENAFSNPELSGDEINAKSIELKEISDKLNLKTERWFELSMILEG